MLSENLLQIRLGGGVPCALPVCAPFSVLCGSRAYRENVKSGVHILSIRLQDEPSQLQQHGSMKNGDLPRAGQLRVAGDAVAERGRGRLPSEAQSTNRALDNRVPIPAEERSSAKPL